MQSHRQWGPMWNNDRKGAITAAVQINFLQNESVSGTLFHHLEMGQSEKQAALPRLVYSLRCCTFHQMQMPPLPGSLPVRAHLERIVLSQL